jgi:hypothetical protein
LAELRKVFIGISAGKTPMERAAKKMRQIMLVLLNLLIFFRAYTAIIAMMVVLPELSSASRLHLRVSIFSFLANIVI